MLRERNTPMTRAVCRLMRAWSRALRRVTRFYWKYDAANENRIAVRRRYDEEKQEHAETKAKLKEAKEGYAREKAEAEERRKSSGRAARVAGSVRRSPFGLGVG